MGLGASDSHPVETEIQRWSPVTSDMGLINAPTECVAREYVEWQESLGRANLKTLIESDLLSALGALPPLSASKERRLFVATRNGWTAQFQSGIQGSDPFPVMSLFSERLDVLAMRVCQTAPNELYQATIWEVYAPRRLGGDTLSYRRSISAANDGGSWVFDQYGEPFDFETVEDYKEPRKRDRFTKNHLIRYLSEFALRPFEDSFYLISPESPAYLFENTTSGPDTNGYTLEEVRSGLPWKRR